MLFTTPRPALHIVGISGSPTSPSRSAALLRAALQVLVPAAASHHEIEVRELPADALQRADFQDPQIVAAVARVQAANVVLVATPIYKAAYSGLLKTFLDLLPQDGLKGKTVVPLATGGSVGHLLAVDYALKPVLGALGARHVLDVVFATDAQFDADDVHGRRPNAEVLARLARALAPLTEQIPERTAEHAPAHRPGPSALAPVAEAAVRMQAPALAVRMSC